MNGKNFTVKNKTLSLALALIMLFSALRVSVLAADGTAENAVAQVTSNGTTVQYDNLPDAVAAAEAAEGSTVQLLTDVKISTRINVKGGNFTIDLNGKTWENTSSSTLFALDVYGGRVTVTSTNGMGTIYGYNITWEDWGETKSEHYNAVIVADDAAVHITNGVRLNELYACKSADLTLDPGVIITNKFFTQADTIERFLSGKALQRCDEEGNTVNEFVPLYNSYRMDDMGCVKVIDHSTCSGHVVNGVCEVCGNACDHSGATSSDATCPDCNATLALTMTLKSNKDSTLVLQFTGIAPGLAYLKGKSFIPGTNERIETVEFKLRSGISLTSDNLIFDDAGVCFILDLNGSALTLSGSILMSSGELTVCNGTVDSEDVFGAFRVYSGGTLRLENITYADTGNAENYSVYDNDGGNVFITSGSYGSVWLLTSGTKELSGGTFTEIHFGGDYGQLLKKGRVYTDATTGAYIPADSMNSSTAVKIAECTDHTMSGGICTKCGFACSHPSYENGKCTVCGSLCLHEEVEIDGDALFCKVCHQQIVIKATNGDAVSYYSDIAVAEKNASDGSTLMLIKNVSLENKVFVTNKNGITLDLNGNSLSGEALCVGNSDSEGNVTEGTLTVVDGSGGKGSVGLDVRNGGTLVFKPDNIYTKITELDIYGGSAKLYGGRICGGKNSLKLYNNVGMADLLPDGYAFRVYSEDQPGDLLCYSDLKNDNIESRSADLVPEQCGHANLPSDFSGENCTYCNVAFVATLKTADGKIRGFEDLAKDWNSFGENGTVTLLQDTVLSENMTFTNGVDCIFDLNGYVIDPDGPGKLFLEGNSKLSVKGREREDPYVISENWVRCDVHIGENGAGTLDITDDLVAFSVVYFYDIGNTQLKHGTFAHIYMDENKDIFISDLLADGCAFFSGAKLINMASVRDYSAVTIEPHTHKTFEDGRCTVCGAKCKHTSGFTDDKCNACGYVCTHEKIDGDGKCSVCSKQLLDPALISVDITWEEMSFSYNEGKKTWDPIGHSLSAEDGIWDQTEKTITVTNKSYRAVKAEFFFNGTDGIEGTFGKASLTVEGATMDGTTAVKSESDATSFKITGGAIDKKQNLGTITVKVAAVLPSKDDDGKKEG